MNKNRFKNIGIIGLGLIGASIAKAVKQNLQYIKVIGIDNNTKTAKGCIEEEIIDIGNDSYKLLSECNLIFICTYVDKIPETVERILPHLKDNTIITDVGSTKNKIVNNVSKLLPENIHFIGGHPMAGKEKSGYINSDPYLFKNRPYILTPIKSSDISIVNEMLWLIRKIGGEPYIMSPEEHDYLVGKISHLPQIIASNLINTVGSEEKLISITGKGYKDTTRIAASNTDMWLQIMLNNKDNLVSLLNEFQQNLENFKLNLLNEKKNEIIKSLISAKEIREEFNDNRKP